MLSLLPVLRQQFTDDNGTPLAGGKLYSYIAGTTTPMTTYQDKDGTVPNQNPIELDAGGWAPPIYIGTAAYKFILKDADDVTIHTDDDIRAPSAASGESDTPAGWTSHVLVAGAAAAELEGETLDTDIYTQAVFEFSIVRGSDVIATGDIAMQVKAGVGRVIEGLRLSDEVHGVTWGTAIDDNIVTLTATASSGLPDCTLKLRRTLVP